jgi:hypothetical protein
MAAMSISASIPAACTGLDCLHQDASSSSSSQSAVFFLGLYMMAIGAGGIKPCVSSFGADQFDDGVPAERLKKSSFFNWFFFSIYIGSFVSGTVVVWVQDHCGWVIGLWIPTLFIALAIAYRQLLARFLDRFFWLIAALSSLSLAVFICCAKRIQVQECFLTVEILLDFISWLETAVYFYRECFLTVELLLHFILLQIELQLNSVQFASFFFEIKRLHILSILRC